MNRKPLKSAGDPSDLDLMLYADGELEGEERAAVEAYLAKVAAGSTKIAQLNLVSSIVREQALDTADKADGIADAVMAKIAAEGTSAKEAPPRKVVSLTSKAALSGRAGRRERSANDNARAIFALAAVAVAAAAGLMIWGRMDTATQQDPVAISTTAAQNPALPPSAAPAAEGDNEHGVEVAAVDFGARMGTIFYVPTKESASNGTTTVVWLNDDDDDDDGGGGGGSSGEE